MLTKANAQFLQIGLRGAITHLEQVASETKAITRLLYEYSVPNTEDGVDAFKALNKNRDSLRRTKADIKRLAQISKELKDFIRS